jgi:hypothetical protein
MSGKRKFWLLSWLLCGTLVISGLMAACSGNGEVSSSSEQSSEESDDGSIPEGTVDFDESWLTK